MITFPFLFDLYGCLPAMSVPRGVPTEAAIVVINDVSHQVGAGSQTCVLGESSQCS